MKVNKKQILDALIDDFRSSESHQQEVQTGQPQGQPVQGGLADMYMDEGAV